MTQGARYTDDAPDAAPTLWAARAAMAEQSFCSRHLRRLFFLPGTRIGVAGCPASPRQRFHLNWNYWWQAHLVDNLIDAQQRQPTHARAALLNRLVRGIWLRNVFRWTNDYYDDMAWLGVSLQRLHAEEGAKVEPAVRRIAKELRDGWTDHGGGGIWWRKNDNFKNVPSNGPAAIMFARWADSGGERPDRQRARSMTEWMEQLLVDPVTGLVWDGAYTEDDGSVREIVKTVYTYCQGAFLGACVELADGDPSGTWVKRAERTIKAVATHLSDDDVLRGRGGGDGGLFMGILLRYLAQAALRLPSSPLVDRAADLVFSSADEAWRNRALVGSGPLFGPEWRAPAQVPRTRTSRLPERDMTVQLSGWMAVEAAALLERSQVP